MDVDGLEPSSAVGFLKSLGNGVSASLHYFETGLNAGNWSVSWVKNGVAYAKIFKAAAPIANATMQIASLAVKAATMVSNVTTTSAGQGGWLDAIKEHVKGRIENFKVNTAREIEWVENHVSDAVSTAMDNVSRRIASGNTIPQRLVHDFLESPMDFLEGGEELKLAEELIGIEVKAVKETEGLEKIDMHHSDPEFMGGEAKQELTPMVKSDHVELHKDLNEHLKKYTNAKGRNMYPRKGNPGRKIRKYFTRQQRLKAMSDFYKGPGAKYVKAAEHFFKQHPKLK